MKHLPFVVEGAEVVVVAKEITDFKKTKEECPKCPGDGELT